MKQQKWEYWILINPAATEMNNQDEIKMYLNAMGDQGWDLVSVLPQALDNGDVTTVFYFKRPLQGMNEDS